MKSYLIGVDIGTQGTKAVLFDTDMTVCATAFVESRLISPCPGTTWQEADDLFSSVIDSVASLMEQSGIPCTSVLGLGIDSQMAGIMGVNTDGEASTVYDSWLDSRCAEYVELMRERAGEKITAITGGPVTYTHGPKILWWKHTHPEAYEKTCKFVLPHGYVTGKLAGLRGEEACFDYTCIQYSGFGDNLRKVWSPELLDLFDIPSQKMARIVSPFEVIGALKEPYASKMKLLAGTPIVAGAGDTSSSVFGSGLFDNGSLLDCAGTASVLCCSVDSFVPDTQYQTMTMMRSPVDGVWFPLAYINGGGMDISWFQKNFTGNPPTSYKELEAVAGKLPCGSEGLLFVPHFSGRVLPSDPGMKGSFVGLDWRHTREHLFRGVMEGISYEYAYYLSILKNLYPHTAFTDLTAVGGGAKSKLFLSIKADVLGLNVTALRAGDTAPAGSAVIAGVGTGVFSDYKEPILKTVQKEDAIPSCAESYRAYAPYRSAYLKTLQTMSALYKDSLWSDSPINP